MYEYPTVFWFPATQKGEKIKIQVNMKLQICIMDKYFPTTTSISIFVLRHHGIRRDLSCCAPT